MPSLLFYGYPVTSYVLLPTFLLAILILNTGLIRLRLTTHDAFFILMCMYMGMQSIRGAYVIEDIRILVFVVLFLSLILLLIWVKSMRHIFQFLHYKNTCFKTKIIRYGVLYNLLYIFTGLILEFYGMSKYDSQGVFWAGTSVAIIPSFVVMALAPRIVSLYKIKTLDVYLLFLSGIVVALYYDSRSLVFLVMFVSLYFFLQRYRKTTTFFQRLSQYVVIILVFMLIYFFSGGGSNSKYLVNRFVPINIENTDRKGIVQESDIGRVLSVKSAIIGTLDTNPIFGNGFYTGRVLMIPYYNAVRNEAGLPSVSGLNDRGVLQLSGFSAFLFDTGAVGLLLIIINSIYSYREVVRRQSFTFKLYMLIVFFVFFGFLLTGTPQVLSTYYLYLLPGAFSYLIGSPLHTLILTKK